METRLGPFEPVADRCYVAVAEPATVNIGLVVGTTGALVVDTGSTLAQGRAIADAARAVAGDVPLTHVVVTHYHYDHLYGLGGFAGLTSLGHENIAADLAASDRVEQELAELGVARDEVVLPQRTFSLAMSVPLGDCHAEIVHFGRGHTASDAVVIVPERGVVFAGDLLESGARPSIGPDSHPAEWPLTLDGTLGTLRRNTVVVPGHGPVMNQMDAVLQRAELKYLWDQARQVYTRGVPVADAYASAQWLWDEDSVRQALPEVYRHLERAGVKPASGRRGLPITPA